LTLSRREISINMLLSCVFFYFPRETGNGNLHALKLLCNGQSMKKCFSFSTTPMSHNSHSLPSTGVSTSLNRNLKSSGAKKGHFLSFHSWHAYFYAMFSFNRVLIESICPKFISIFYISSVVKKLRKPLCVV